MHSCMCNGVCGCVWVFLSFFLSFVVVLLNLVVFYICLIFFFERCKLHIILCSICWYVFEMFVRFCDSMLTKSYDEAKQ